MPPFEWHNAQHTNWAKELGCQTINFTVGSGSNRDFAPEDHKAYVPSEELLQDILDHEKESESGLNGHLLLLHLGTNRKDKVYAKLGKLIDALMERGYEIVRVDKLLAGKESR